MVLMGETSVPCNPARGKPLPHILGNVGFEFTWEGCPDIRDLLPANGMSAAACAVLLPHGKSQASLEHWSRARNDLLLRGFRHYL